MTSNGQETQGVTAVVEQRKTGYYVLTTDDDMYRDPEGHIWFSATVAQAIARKLGTWYERGSGRSIKQVVVAYVPRSGS